VTSLQYAAEHGHGFALWQLGRMYAEGDGVARDDYRAFEYFQKFADTHADENPAIPRSRFVANAFVALGHYYLDGIPNTAVVQSPELARRMFAHAASYFGDSEAQYQLATLYLDGNGVTRSASEDASSTRTTDGRPLASASQVDAATHRPSADTERPPMTKRCAVDDLIALHVDVLHAVTLRDDPPV